MTIDRFFVDPVDRVRPTWTTDRYGNQVPDYENGTVVPMTGWLATVDTVETTGGRQAITTDKQLSLPADADVQAPDRFTHDSMTYRIMGDVERAKRPSGQHHIVVHLQRVEG